MFGSFFEKNAFVFADETWHYKAVNQLSITQKFRLTILTDFQTNL